MEYRDIEYSVVQGVGRHMWTWSTSVAAGVMVMGKAHSKDAAVTAAEKAIDRSLAVNKVRPSLPHRPIDEQADRAAQAASDVAETSRSPKTVPVANPGSIKQGSGALTPIAARFFALEKARSEQAHRQRQLNIVISALMLVDEVLQEERNVPHL